MPEPANVQCMSLYVKDLLEDGSQGPPAGHMLEKGLIPLVEP